MRLSAGRNYFDYANSPLSFFFFFFIFSFCVVRFSKNVFAIFYRRRFILLRELIKDCSSFGLWKTFSPPYLLTEKACTLNFKAVGDMLYCHNDYIQKETYS
jgi:hypothetical protein